MDIKGGYAKPHWTDVLWVQLVILPLTVYRWALWYSLHWNKALICRWTKFYVLWLWRFGILREEYGREEQLYVIRSHTHWNLLNWEYFSSQEKLGSQSRPVRPAGGGGGGGDVGVGAVAEGQLCSLEGGEGGGEADQDGSEWQVELSLCLNYSAIFVTGINSTGATWRTTAQTEWHLKINANDGAKDFKE